MALVGSAAVFAGRLGCGLCLTPDRVRSVLILAQDRTPLRAFADNEGVWRYPVTLDEVSPLYVEALLEYEDRWFYQHPGINPLALARAGWQWLRVGE